MRTSNKKHRDRLTGHTIDITGGSIVWAVLLIALCFKIIPTISENGLKPMVAMVWCANDLKCREGFN